MELIPLFPLEIIVFPGELLNLHIFEARYQQLINDSKTNDIEFGIPYYQKDRPLRYGSTVKLVEISKTYPNGRLDIKTQGVRPFEVKRYRKEYPKKLYPGGYVDFPYWENDGDKLKYDDILTHVNELYKVMKINDLPKEFTTPFTTFQIAHKVGLNKDQEYHFLQIVTELERQNYLLNHLSKLIPMVQQMEEMRKKVQMNGHFKNLKPPVV